MTKLSRKNLEQADLGYYINNIWSAFTLAESKEDIKDLFYDLLTRTEIEMLAKRFEVSRRLLREQLYDTITQEMNVTSTTISKMSNMLHSKGEGVRKMHSKLENLELKNERMRERRLGRREHALKGLVKPNKTLLGAVLKSGLQKFDKKMFERSKRKSAEDYLSI